MWEALLQSLHVVNVNSYSYAGRYTCMPKVGLGWSGPSLLTCGIIIGPGKTCIVDDLLNYLRFQWVWQCMFCFKNNKKNMRNGYTFSGGNSFELIFASLLKRVCSEEKELAPHKRSVNPSLDEHNMPCLSKQCRSRSADFWRSQIIWICTVCH